MFFKKKKVPKIDLEQKELFEHAQQRIKQKKRLFFHFIVFLTGTLFMIFSNLFLKIGKEITLLGIDWFVYAVLFWTFFIVLHALNVFVFHKFMDKEWEMKQMERLLAKQKERIKQMEKEIMIPDSSMSE